MRLILGLSSAAIVTVLLATAGGHFAAASPDDCSISGMQGSLACPLSTWTPAPAPQQQATPAVPQQQAAPQPAPQRAESTKACTPRYELYSSHVKWVNDCPNVSQAP